ncbi:MAG: hypothetical protein V4726_10450 [Verrucomicrobiota bacterium]
MAQNIPRGTPARLLVLLTLLTGLVAVSAWRDALQRDRAVWLNYPTALGDTAYFQPALLPVQIRVGERVVQLTAAPEKPLRRRDDRMFRVAPGLGEALPFRLYTPQEHPAESGDPPLYARTAPGEFVHLQAGLQENISTPAPPVRISEKVLPPPAPAGDSFPPETVPVKDDFPDKKATNKSL